MAKGIVYLMTTAVAGLLKIGKTGSSNYQERMRFLEGNGYYNVTGLKRFFAIELSDYDEKKAYFTKYLISTRLEIASCLHWTKT